MEYVLKVMISLFLGLAIGFQAFAFTTPYIVSSEYTRDVWIQVGIFKKCYSFTGCKWWQPETFDITKILGCTFLHASKCQNRS
jgi:hypothetical protein